LLECWSAGKLMVQPGEQRALARAAAAGKHKARGKWRSRPGCG
jgi:hypothetical protein